MRIFWTTAEGAFTFADLTPELPQLAGTIPQGKGPKRLAIWLTRREWGQATSATVKLKRAELKMADPYAVNWLDGTPGVLLIMRKSVQAAFYAGRPFSIQLHSPQ